jgi:hypothetical protein
MCSIRKVVGYLFPLWDSDYVRAETLRLGLHGLHFLNDARSTNST